MHSVALQALGLCLLLSRLRERSKLSMGRASRFEPIDYIYVDASNSLRNSLQQVGWYDFVKKFRGYSLEVSR